MLRNIKLIICYDGTAYHGWQMQDNAITIQEELCKAIKQILRHDATVQGCSRTDTGVHANMFCCNFKTENCMPSEKIVYGLNAVLPFDIRILSCEETTEDFNARFDCKGKEYIYKIWNSKVGNPFLNKYALHFPYYLDVEMLNLQAKQFVGEHDFASFCAAGSVVKDTVRTIYDCSVKREGDLITISVKGDGFLYNMVRIIVGTLIYIGNGKLPKDSITDIINSKDRKRAGITAKAHGLYLNEVYY